MRSNLCPFHTAYGGEALSSELSQGACGPRPPGVAAASPGGRAEQPQMAGRMWTLGRRSAAGLLPRSAPPGLVHTGAGAPWPARNMPLRGRGDLRAGTAEACASSHAVSNLQASAGPRAQTEGDRAAGDALRTRARSGSGCTRETVDGTS